MTGKRAIDVVVAASLLVVFLPAMAIIALAIRLTMGRPVLFTQERPGLHGDPFRMYKFRTMSEARDANGELLPEEDRITPLGAALRATSLDEIPELWNVLRGDMSLVGPRPLLPEYLPLYNREQARRHEVRPGVTGLAQVEGRNALTWERRFELDVWYVDHWSPWLDVKIIARTLRAVLSRRGVNQKGIVGSESFRGSPPESAAADQNSTPSTDEAGDDPCRQGDERQPAGMRRAADKE